jgi:hypothetical protein
MIKPDSSAFRGGSYGQNKRQTGERPAALNVSVSFCVTGRRQLLPSGWTIVAATYAGSGLAFAYGHRMPSKGGCRRSVPNKSNRPIRRRRKQAGTCLLVWPNCKRGLWSTEEAPRKSVQNKGRCGQIKKRNRKLPPPLIIGAGWYSARTLNRRTKTKGHGTCPLYCRAAK